MNTTMLDQIRTIIREEVGVLHVEIKALDAKVSGLEMRVGGLENKASSLENKASGLEMRMGGIEDETRGLGVLIEDTNHKVDLLAEQYEGTQNHYADIKEVLDFHTDMIGALAMDMALVKEVLHIGARA